MGVELQRVRIASFGYHWITSTACWLVLSRDCHVLYTSILLKPILEARSSEVSFHVDYILLNVVWGLKYILMFGVCFVLRTDRNLVYTACCGACAVSHFSTFLGVPLVV